MHLNPHHTIDFLTLGPIALAQLYLAWAVVSWAWRRHGWRMAAPAALGVLAFGFAFTLAVLTGYARVHRVVVAIWRYLPDAWWPHIGVVRGAMFLWGFSSAAAVAIYLLKSWLTPKCVLQFSPARRRVMQSAGHLAIAAPFGLAAFGAGFLRTDFRVREVGVPISGLHPDLQGLRILQLSDIHLSAYLSEREFARVIDAANGLRAHLAVITGDLITTFGDPLDACLKQLARLRADAGSLGCLGNHEIYARAERYTAEQGARLGIPFLRQENRVLRFGGAAINFAGVDYQPFENKDKYLTGAETLIEPGIPNVLLSHNPDVLPAAARKGYDLMLAGHTHGGQVTVEILDQMINPARVFTRFVSGYYRVGKTSGYVTRGIGTIGIPMRLGATPEITLLKLTKA